MKKRKKKDCFNPVLEDSKIRVQPLPEEPVDPPELQGGPPDAPSFTIQESHAFLEAMSDVTPLPDREKKASRNPRAVFTPSHPAPDDAREALEHLNGLVHGSIDMDISFTDEYMEGAVKGVGRKIMRRLKRGQFPVQDFVDLHGLTRDKARERVREFLLDSHKKGRRCVLIVHGRGLNSPSSHPVLKKQIPLWFATGPIRKVVLAFATAKPYDGGAGAVYVLLRQR